MKIYIIRHGETEWNVQGRIQGRKGSDLTETGKQQCLCLASQLKDNNIKTIYSSPLERARRSAEIISNEIGTTLFYDDRLMECSFGLFEGLTKQEIQEKYPIEYETRENDKFNVACPSGESYNNVYERVKRFALNLFSFRNLIRNENILIVAHDIVCRCLYSILTKTDKEIILHNRLEHGTIWVVEK